MADRNIKRYREAGRETIHKNPMYGLSCTEGYHLMYDNEAVHRQPIDIMLDAFYMGVEAGTRIAKKKCSRRKAKVQSL